MGASVCALTLLFGMTGCARWLVSPCSLLTPLGTPPAEDGDAMAVATTLGAETCCLPSPRGCGAVPLRAGSWRESRRPSFRPIARLAGWN